eukprot:6466878-Amphidinium_carterae.1
MVDHGFDLHAWRQSQEASFCAPEKLFLSWNLLQGGSAQSHVDACLLGASAIKFTQELEPDRRIRPKVRGSQQRQMLRLSWVSRAPLGTKLECTPLMGRATNSPTCY